MVAPRAFDLGVVGVHRHEQLGQVALGEFAALVELDEHVGVARHQHLVAPGGGELVAQHEAERQHHVLLHGAVSLRSGVLATVPGVEDDDRLVHAERARLRRHGRARHRRLQAAGAERSGAGLHQGASGIGKLGVHHGFGWHDLEHEVCPLAVLSLLDDGLLDDHRAGDIDDDARLAGSGQAAAERFDKAGCPFTGVRGQLEHDVWQLDEHPVRVGERENLELDVAIQADDESSAGPVAFGCSFRCGRGGFRGLRRSRVLCRCCQGKGSRAERCPKKQ